MPLRALNMVSVLLSSRKTPRAGSGGRSLCSTVVCGRLEHVLPRVTGRVLVGCDGIGSCTRKALVPDASLQQCGALCLRGAQQVLNHKE